VWSGGGGGGEGEWSPEMVEIKVIVKGKYMLLIFVATFGVFAPAR